MKKQENQTENQHENSPEQEPQISESRPNLPADLRQYEELSDRLLILARKINEKHAAADSGIEIEFVHVALLHTGQKNENKATECIVLQSGHGASPRFNILRQAMEAGIDFITTKAAMVARVDKLKKSVDKFKKNPTQPDD